MAGFAGILGHAAQGFEQARQADIAKQFADEQNRRAMAGELLQKIAMDETLPPEVRGAATQGYFGISQPGKAGIGKPLDFGKIITPIFEQMAQARAAQKAQSQTQIAAPPAPPGITNPAIEGQRAQLDQATKQAQGVQTPPGSFPGASMLPQPPPPPLPNQAPGQVPPSAASPAAQPGAGAVPPPPANRPDQAPTPQANAGATLAQAATPQPGAFNFYPSYEQHTAQLAGRQAALTKAQEEGVMKQGVYTLGPNGESTFVPVSGTGQPMGAGVPNAFNPLMFRNIASMMHPVNYLGPNGESLPGIMNKLTGEITGQNGEVLPPGTQLFAPSLQGRTSTESMNASGAITRTSTPNPHKPGGAATVPAAQGGGKATGGGRAGKAAGETGNPQTNWANATDPVAQEAVRWATQGQKPAGGVMAERQVLNYMQHHGLQPALPVPPAMQQKVQELFVARNSAIDLIDDITRNKQVFNDLISAGKIAVASNPDGTGVVQRAANLTDQEARVAGDFQQLVEHANLLRGPLGATGFRGHEAWSALQAQRGKPLGDPRITQQVLTGMRQRLIGLNNADKMVLSGHGMEAPPPNKAMTISRDIIKKAAQDHGVSEEEAARQAKEQGYEIQ